MSNWAAGGGVKIERAKEHLRNLDTDIKAFWKRDPYRPFSERDEQGGQIVYRLRVSEEPPLRWGAIAGDVLHNLRSALDILWRNSWYPEGGGTTDRSIEFPILDSFDDLKRRYPLAKFAKKDRKQTAVNLVYGVKPYRGGNDLLWMLLEANAADKHRLLIPVYGWIGTTILDVGAAIKSEIVPPVSLPIAIKWAEPLSPVKDGAEIFRAPIDDTSHVDMNPKIPLFITFGEGEMLKGKPLLTTLSQIASEVDGVVERFRTAGLIE